MINLTSYIIEKFKIHKGINKNSALSTVETIMVDYLDRMIITDEEKYIIDDVIKAINTSWLKDIKEDESINCYYYCNISKFKETVKLKSDFEFIFLTPSLYKKLWPTIFKFSKDNENNNSNSLYYIKMKNQFVFIVLDEDKDDNLLFYKDSFTTILFSTKKLV